MCRYPVGATLREALASVPASAPLVHLRNREVAKTNGRYIFDCFVNLCMWKSGFQQICSVGDKLD